MNELNQVPIVKQDMNPEEEVKAKTLPIATEAMGIIVRDQTTLIKANQVFLLIDAARKEIKDYFGPIVEKWKETKKSADEGRALTLRKWEKAEEPLVRARMYLDTQIVDYKREQDKKREEEQELLRQEGIKAEMERRKKEEKERLAQAVELEAAGATEEAEALIAETIEENQKPVEVYIPPTATEKVELKGMTTVTNWHAECFDKKALFLAIGQGRCPEAYGDPNMAALNSQATHLKKEMRIPGVKSVSETKSRPTGR
jgi:hypothetical protein